MSEHGEVEGVVGVAGRHDQEHLVTPVGAGDEHRRGHRHQQPREGAPPVVFVLTRKGLHWRLSDIRVSP